MPKKAAAASTGAPDDGALIALAHTGLDGVASAAEIGAEPSIERGEATATVSFPSLLPGYPGWRWEVVLSDGEGGQWGVLETHLVPGPDALVAPDWVPWADRLEEYRRSEAERLEAEADDEDDVDEDDLDDDDLDGVDIDQLDLGDDDMDPSPLEMPGEPTDVFDHVDIDDEESD